jgi:hypothetical protein
MLCHVSTEVQDYYTKTQIPSLIYEKYAKNSHFSEPEAKNLCYATHLFSICTMVAFCYPGMLYRTAYS